MRRPMFLIIALAWILAACVLPTHPTLETSSSPPTVLTSTTTLLPSQIQAATATAQATPTPSPVPRLSLPATDEVVLTIPNDQPYSGIAGEPKPDWIGWGAQAFSMAPNGDIWILDSAAQPPRLLRLEKPYKTPQLISLDGLVVGPADVEVASDAIWVLDIAAQPPRLLKLSTGGDYQKLIDLPRGLWPQDGLTGIALAQDGSLLAELEGGADLYRLFDQNGQVAPHRLPGYSYDDRLYTIQSAPFSLNATIHAGDVTIPISSTIPIGGPRVIGAAPDGTFYVELSFASEQAGNIWLREILSYNLQGELLGIATPHPTDVITPQDVVVGPDGFVYQLVSNPDHSVQVVRLGFKSPELALAVPTASPTQTPTPLPSLLTTWTVTPAGASDLEMARHTLLTFFTLLHDGRYPEAVPLYGGLYDSMRNNNPSIPPNDYAALWESSCTNQRPCLSVANIVDEKQVTPGEFSFLIEFIWIDGTLFKLGPCCGATEAEMPPVWQFPYTVKKIDGMFKVMEEPVYMP